MPAQLNLTIYQGDYFSRSFAIKTEDSQTGVRTPMDLTNLTFQGYIKKTFDSQNFIPFDIIVDDPLEGKITLYLSSNTTKEMRVGKYVWDLEVIENPNNIYKLLVGQLEIKPEVTV